MADIFSVSGNSMNPILKDGDKVTCLKTTDINKGDLVILDVKSYGKIIKKVKWINEKELRVEGTNPRCYSSYCDFNHPISSIIGTAEKLPI